MQKNTGRRNFLKAVTLSGAAVTTTLGAAESGTKDSFKVSRSVLGKTGAKTSRLGLGLGSRFWRPFSEDPEKTEEILTLALSYGINYWDTARGYGESEEMIGPTVEKHRDKIYLVSKSPSRDYDGFMRDLETGLKLLRTDHIDLYHLHNMNPNKDDMDAIEKGAAKAAMKAREEGMIKNFGLTGHTGPEILMEGINRWNPAAVMSVFPADRPMDGAYEDKLLPLAREKNVGMIAMKSIRHARNTSWPGPQLIRYAMSLPGITTTIVGLDSVAHLKENVEMASNFKPMTKDEMAVFSQKVKGELLAFGDAHWENAKYDDDCSNPLWA